MLEALKDKCTSITSTKNKKIKVILFSERDFRSSKTFSDYEAARLSASQKKKTFESLGFNVEVEELIFESTRKPDFDNLIQAANNDNNTEAIIVQNPIPVRLKDVLDDIAESKDIDCLSRNHKLHATCATGDAICRIVAPFLNSLPSAKLAINGSKGFVGSSVQTGLNDFQDKISFLCCIDPKYTPQDISTSTNIIQKCACGDEEIKSSNIVISVVGKVGVLNRTLLNSSQKLVVNGSFIPIKKDSKVEILSDINQSELEISLDRPQNITWVPGGIGPLEMAVLAERVLKKFFNDLPSWSLDVTGQPSFPEWDQILR